MSTTTRALVLVIVAVTVAHGPQLRCGYVYDDFEGIIDNPRLQSWQHVGELWSTNYWGSRNIGLYRPLVQMSYLVDGAGLGFDPVASHLFQVVL